MNTQMVEEQKYGSSRTIEATFDDAVKRTTDVLAAEGFGVLSEIRIDEKLKDKLGVEFRKYAILGACNPPLAYRALQHDINIGLLLPCNVIVYESGEQGRMVVAAVDAKAMMSVAGESPEIEALASEVNARLRDALESI